MGETAAVPGDRRRRVEITDRDRELLSFLAEHRLVLLDHVQALLGVSARTAATRLRRLCGAGYLESDQVFHRQPPLHQITRKGLSLLGSDLPPPRLDLRAYEHDVGVAWLWLAARSGTFGPMRSVLSERTLRSRDLSADGRERPLAVRLGGYGPGGRERLHYPDLILVTDGGKRIAVELELSGKGRTRREKILMGYAADGRIDGVLYLVGNRSIGRAIEASARRIGISSLVHVQPVSVSVAAPGAGTEARRVAERARTGAREGVAR